MNTLEFHNRDIVYDVPEDWDEMTHKQAVSILKHAHRFSLGLININDFYVRSLYSLLGIKFGVRAAYRFRYKSNADAIKKLDNIRLMVDAYCSFLLKNSAEPGQVALNYTSVTQHLPTFRFRLRKYYGPSDLCMGLTNAQFRRISELITEFQDSEYPKTLAHAMAVMYLPQKRFLWLRKLIGTYNGIPHRKYTAELAESRIRSFCKLPSWITSASMAFFENSVRYIMTEDIDVGGNIINLKPLFSDSGDSSGIGMIATLYSVAQTGIFGNASEVDDTGFFDILLSLYNAHETNKKINKQYAENK